jgi:hypothetical protein
MNDKPRCKAIAASGEPCTNTHGLSEDGLCLYHDPNRTEELRAQAARGAKAAKEANLPLEVPAVPKTLSDCVLWSAWTARAVANGDIDAGAARIIVQAVGELRRSLEKRDLEQEAKALRAEVVALKKKLSR